MEDSKINVCFCTDKNLINFIPTVVNSILTKTDPKKVLIHIIHNLEDENNAIDIKTYLENILKVECMLYFATWDNKYEGLSHITSATMLRVFIPKLLSEFRRAIYFDIDLIVNVDLEYMSLIETGPTGISMKNSRIEDWKEQDNGKSSGNCGVMVLDLEKLRKNAFLDKCKVIHEKHGGHDQYIINKYCNGEHGILEDQYNIYFGQDDYLINEFTDFILHFVGDKKPYFKKGGKFQYLWDRNIPDRKFELGKMQLEQKKFLLFFKKVRKFIEKRLYSID